MFEDVKKITYKEDYPKPVPGPDDVIIKVHYCAICGSDLTNFKYKMYQTPLVIGHEFAGEIIELGKNIKGFEIGDKATGINIISEEGYGRSKALGIMRDGGFAEYVKVPKEYLFHTPKSISIRDCSMLESFAVVLRAIKLSEIENNQKIAIIGGGSIGLTTLNTLLSEKDPNYVLVIEPHEFLREKAIEMGATDSVPPQKNKIRKFLKKNGLPSYIFECAGNEKSLMLALDLIVKGGTIMNVSVFKGNISFPMFLINSKEITLKGSISHDEEDIKAAIELFEKKKIDPSKLISKVVPLKDIQNAFEEFLEPGDRKFIKIIVKI